MPSQAGWLALAGATLWLVKGYPLGMPKVTKEI